MPTPVNASIQGPAGHVLAIKTLQSYLGQPVRTTTIDHRRAGEVMKLQAVLVGLGKLSSLKVCYDIDDQALSGKIIECQVAANLP